MSTAPFELQRIDHVVLRVCDLSASLAFYTGVLGCTVVRRRDDLGMVHLRAGASMIDLVSVDGRLGRRGGAAPGADAHNLDHVCLRIAPFDDGALRAHLRAHGVDAGATSDNFGAEGDGPSLTIRDPDGNGIELKGHAAA